MRDIKFRAWDKENNRFYEPTFEAHRGKVEELLIDFSGELNMRTLYGVSHESLFPDRFVLQQYTGLKDENGKEIYEGDILYDYNARCHVIQYFQPDARFISIYLDEYVSGNWDDSNESIGLVWVKCEVIGNIYANSELLEDKHE